MICSLCPHNCDLNGDSVGKCLVRKNINGHIELTHYGRVSLIAVEPIEKRPLYHFFPGSKFLSVGFYGCSFSCSFCQNFKASQKIGDGPIYSPEKLIDLALKREVKGIAFTYNEPTVHYEYLMDVGGLARQNGLAVAVKSNGFVNKPYLDDLKMVVDAWNIDLKGDDEAYKEVCGGSVAPVLQTIESLAGDSHLEISYLVVPSMLESWDFHTRTADWIANLSVDIPVHLLYCYPVYKMREHYRKDELVPIVEIFRERLNHVYISNTFDSLQQEYGQITLYNMDGDGDGDGDGDRIAWSGSSHSTISRALGAGESQVVRIYESACHSLG